MIPKGRNTNASETVDQDPPFEGGTLSLFKEQVYFTHNYDFQGPWKF